MRLLKVLLILAISVSLIMLAAACGKPEQGAQPGPTDWDDDAAAEVTEPGPASGGSKAVSGKAKEIWTLLEKADSIDNYYTEGTFYQNMATTSWKVWRKGKLMKVYQDTAEGMTVIFDFGKKEQIRYKGLEGKKAELSEFELAVLPIQYTYLSKQIFEYLMPENAQYFGKLDISEEVVNGTKCVLLDLVHFSGEEVKYYICKETGFVIKQGVYLENGEKVSEFSRTVLETGGVTDADFALPEGLVLEVLE